MVGVSGQPLPATLHLAMGAVRGGIMSSVDKKIAGALSALDKGSVTYENDRNCLIARFSVHSERTGEGQAPGRMDLSDEATERLLFYGRQDAAHALLNTISLLSDMRDLKRSIRRQTWFLGGVALLLILLLFSGV